MQRRRAVDPARSGSDAGRTRRSLVVLAASTSGPTRKQIPIFPLNIVALPYASVPLMVFEPRYRVLFNTLLDGEKGVEEGLVQKDSPFAGSKQFGMCYVEPGTSGMTMIGTLLEIQNFVHEPDGRIYVLNKGVERFKVSRVVVDKPVLICEVETLPEDQDDSEQAKQLAGEVADLFRSTLRLHNKMLRDKKQASGERDAAGSIQSAEEDEMEPEELTSLTPWQLSYWLAHVFQESRIAQQNLLEMGSTLERLQQEKDIFEQTLRYYQAAIAVKGVFAGGSSDPPQQPPPGGPD